jgi:hypothetical protein
LYIWIKCSHANSAVIAKKLFSCANVACRESRHTPIQYVGLVRMIHVIVAVSAKPEYIPRREVFCMCFDALNDMFRKAFEISAGDLAVNHRVETPDQRSLWNEMLSENPKTMNCTWRNIMLNDQQSLSLRSHQKLGPVPNPHTTNTRITRSGTFKATKGMCPNVDASGESSRSPG